jgi:Holliday junction resolvase
MSGRKSRDKGARGERELCGMLRDNLGGEFCRNLKQYQQTQEGDIAQLVGPYLVEVKNHATLNLRAWWQQTLTAADKKGAIPCLAYKITRAGWRFVVPLESAWASGHQWGRDLQYTQTLYPEGFYMLVRERG